MEKSHKALKGSLELKCMTLIIGFILAVMMWIGIFFLLKNVNDTLRITIFLVGISITVLVSWIILRRIVIIPIQSLEKAAKSLAGGNFSISLDIKTNDEIERLSKNINESIYLVNNILQRVKNGSNRLIEFTQKVENEIKRVSETTKIESEAISNIASSLEQMNSASAEISTNTEILAATTEEKATSMEEMVSSISHVANNAQDLSNTVDSTSASIEELSATIKEVANKTEELIAASEETLTATEEISSSIKEVEQSAKESATLSEKVKNDASTFGIASVEKTIEGIQNIKSSFDRTANFIKKLSGRSDEIGKILNVIDEITDQTTLLALNAAILAAQAGEHGKGFSVVADEIKDLAERTSFSTREIAELIQAVQQEVKDATIAMDEGLSSVDEGLKVARDAVEALQKIVDSSKQSAEMSLSIERSTAEQSKTTKLVSEAMERVKNMVNQVAKATTEQSKGALLITRATEKMRDVAKHVMSATGEQLISIKQISESVEDVSEKSRQIANAVNEQRGGANLIFNSVEKIKEIPKYNINSISEINQTLKGLLRNTELLHKEIEMIKLYKEGLATIKQFDTIKFGIEPVGISPQEALEKFRPLSVYLSKNLNRNVELRVVSDHEGAIRDIGQGTTQLSFMSPYAYVKANKKFGTEAVVKVLTDGKSSRHAVIIVRSDSKIGSVADIKDCTFAFGEQHSIFSHIAQRIMLLEAGIDLKDLRFYEYLGSYDEIANAVLDNKFDAGAVEESIAYKLKDKGIKIIALSEDLPDNCICVSKTLPERDKISIKSALTTLIVTKAEGSSVLTAIDKRYTAFEEASNTEYSRVRDMMSSLGII